jgi:hypothetical protein
MTIERTVAEFVQPLRIAGCVITGAFGIDIAGAAVGIKTHRHIGVAFA